MIVINLSDSNKSEIKYKISTFPDGQQNVEMTGYIDSSAVLVKSRMNNWKDLELIACTVACLRRMNIREVHLYAPYILGARSDRKFVNGGNSYLVDVVAPFLKSLKFRTIRCVDVHSEVANACIPNLVVEDNQSVVQQGINSFYSVKEGWFYSKPLENCVFVSPDAGSLKKMHTLATALGYNKDIIVCSKSRDKDGKLSNVVVPYDLEWYNKDKVIIDDICDGGRTFINIAKKLKEGPYENSKAKIYLIVTHGIFSAGFGELQNHFTGIYCTNSVKDIGDEWHDGMNIHKLNGFIKQFNII